MASTEKLPSGRYRGLYYQHGKKKRVAGTFREKKDALHKAQEIEVAARRRAPGADGQYNPTMTWGDWCAVWWETRDVEKSTAQVEATIRDVWLIPEFGDRPMNTISTDVVQTWLNRVKRETSAGTAIRYYTLLRTSFRMARKRKVLLEDPCEDVVKPSVPKTRREHYEDEELVAIKAHLSERHREAVDVLLETGMRPGELCGLHRDHIGKTWLSIADSSPCGLNIIKPMPKDEDEREVPITLKARGIFRKWASEIPARTGCGVPHEQRGFVCSSDLALRQTNGRPMRTVTLQLAFRKARNAAGIRHGSVYSLRHTFATRLAEAGVDEFEIARLLGHATTKQSATYVHRTKAKAAKVLEALGDPRSNQDPAWDEHGTEGPSSSLPPAPLKAV